MPYVDLSIDLAVDPAAAAPPYEQVRSQIEARTVAGELPAGERLPTVRALAGELGLAVNTVARAYRELEQAGVITTRGRQGTFVALRGADVEREARIAAEDYARRVRALEIDPERAVALVRQAVGSTSSAGRPAGPGHRRA